MFHQVIDRVDRPPEEPRRNLPQTRETHPTCIDGVSHAASRCGSPKMRVSEVSIPAWRRRIAVE